MISCKDLQVLTGFEFGIAGLGLDLDVAAKVRSTERCTLRAMIDRRRSEGWLGRLSIRSLQLKNRRAARLPEASTFGPRSAAESSMICIQRPCQAAIASCSAGAGQTLAKASRCR